MTLSFSNEKMGPLKAVLALIIVLGHFFYYSNCPFFIPFHELAATAVAMFFFISGFGLVKTWEKKGPSYLKGFFTYRLTKILFPAIIIFLIHLLLCGTGGTNIYALFKRLVKLGQAYPPQYWFIFVIVYDYLLFWFSFKFLPTSLRISCLFLGSLLLIVFTTWAGYDRCWWICSFSFPCGAVYAKHEEKINSICGKSVLLFVISLFVLFLTAVGLYLTGKQYLWTLFYLVVPFGIALIVAALKPDKVVFPFLSFFGVISYEIYLSHITAMEFFHRSPAAISSDWAYILSVLATTIALSFIINRLCTLIIPRK